MARNDADFPGLHRCQQSGSFDSYLKAEQPDNSDQYQTDQKVWDDLRTARADDGYVAAYAADNAACSTYVYGKVLDEVGYVFAIRFKDTSSAAASYKAELTPFHLSDEDTASIKAVGGTVQQGSATGLGDNSTVVSFDLGFTIYVALWQSKEFLVVVLLDNVSASTGASATTRINSRVH